MKTGLEGRALDYYEAEHGDMESAADCVDLMVGFTCAEVRPLLDALTRIERANTGLTSKIAKSALYRWNRLLGKGATK